MLFYCLASVADSDATLSEQRDKSMCALVTLNVTNKYISSGKAQWGLLKYEVRSLKSKIPVQNGCQKNHATKTHKTNPNIIVT